MLIQVNILIQNMVFDLILIQPFLQPYSYWSKNVIIFGVDNSSSGHNDNKKKKILVKGLTQGLDDSTKTAEVQH